MNSLLPKPLAILCALALGALISGCSSYSNSEGSQDGENNIRIETSPSNCKLILLETGREFRTPAELGVDFFDQETEFRLESELGGVWEGTLLSPGVTPRGTMTYFIAMSR